ncbi:terminase large subunit domain-containing protein [Neisseria dentiae]|uniref:terminase large subunit domain-containing protein n=1 Tax=Neisseria dentiae TaxID=194197 RepID=UPI0035A09566
MEKRDQVEIAPNIDPRTVARSLYWQGWRITAIGRHLGIKPATVHSWKQRENWDGGSPVQRVAASVEARLIQLIHLPKKSDGDYKEIRQLSGLILGAADRPAEKRPSEHPSPGAEKFIADLTANVPTVDKPPRGQKERGRDAKERPSEKPHKNLLHPEQIRRMNEIFREQCFGYQQYWFEQYQKMRFRNILKSRQIGATFYFAREAFLTSLKTGINSIFLSASRAQAYQFRQYIAHLAAMVDAELKGGDVIQLHNGAELYFLGTNSRTAQGRNGNLYVDEYFWIPDFQKLQTLAEPMASQKHLKTTFFSTPSSEGHPAYGFWSGSDYNDGRPRSEHIKLDLSHAALKNGRLDADAQWRQIVTIHDALASGCNLFDLDYLRRRNPPDKFAQLFECQFVPDGDSVFTFSELQKCGVDSWDAWADWYKHLAPKPCGNAPVWIGYDPAHTGDAAGLVVATAPAHGRDKFCVVQKNLLPGSDFESQAAFIRKLLDVYNVQKIVIDTNGIGVAVADLVKKFFPSVTCMTYTPDVKGLMVLKMQNLLKNGRVEWDSGDVDMQMAFLSVRRTVTASGRYTTYESVRSKDASHGDLAWAAMMLFFQEPLDGAASGRVEIDS